jgi:hypothetical protein
MLSKGHMMSIWLSSLSAVCLIERSIGHHVPGTLFVNLELRETYCGAIGAADFDVESPVCLAADRVSVIDGPKISCLDAKLRDVLRDGYEAELLVCDVGHLWVVPGRG